MNFNMKCDIERNRGLYVGNVELSCVGRSGRKRVTDENFDAFLEKLKDAHDELLGNSVAYHTASVPSAPPTHHSEVLTRKAGDAIVSRPAYKAKQKARTKQAAELAEKIGAMHGKKQKITRRATKKEVARIFASA